MICNKCKIKEAEYLLSDKKYTPPNDFDMALCSKCAVLYKLNDKKRVVAIK